MGGLPGDLPAAVFIVLHLGPEGPSFLSEILTWAGLLQTIQSVEGEVVTPGRTYGTPPDHYLLVELGHVGVTRGQNENRFHPAVDVPFR